MLAATTYRRSPAYDRIALAIIESVATQREAKRGIRWGLPRNALLSHYVWQELWQLPE